MHESPATKTIPIAQLKPGMVVLKMNQSWFRTPFLRHHRTIRGEEDIVLLQKAGVTEVTVEGDGEFQVTNEDCPGCQDGMDDSADASPDSPGHSPEDHPFAQLLADIQARLANEFRLFASGAPFSGDLAMAIVDEIAGYVSQNPHEAMLHAQLDALLRRNHTLSTHSIDVMCCAMAFSAYLGHEERAISQIGIGALLHDIGILRLPSNVFNKPSLYTPEELAIMQTHPQLGEAVVREIRDLPAATRSAAERIALEHHLRPNGAGYPSSIPFIGLSPDGQIVRLADAYASLTVEQPYRPAVSPARALKYIYRKSQSRDFHPEFTARFIAMIGVYPTGTIFSLKSGQLALVVKQNPENRISPYIVDITAAGQPLGEPYILTALSDHICAVVNHTDLSGSLGEILTQCKPRRFECNISI